MPRNLPDFKGLKLDFDLIDSHHHLFDLDAVYYPWLSDRPESGFLLGDYEALKKNYLPEDYLSDADGLRPLRTVHVEAEADHAHPLAETRWLEEVMKKPPVPNAIVAHAWLHKPETESILEAQSAFKAVRGIRSKPLTSFTAESREDVKGCAGSMQDENWLKGLRLFPKYGFSWDLRVPFWHLQEAVEVCMLLPDLPVVVEHTGLPWDRSKEGLMEWGKVMKALAACRNVFLKISELGLATAPWDYNDNRRIVREALELFGFDRCMFASNFPVAGLRIDFVSQVKAIAHMVQDCSREERRELFHDTALKFYRL